MRKFLLVAICILFVGYIPLVTHRLDATFVLNNAYGQTPSPGDIGSATGSSDPSNASGPDTGNISGPDNPSSVTGPDPSMDNNLTDSFTPGDTSSGISASNNVVIQNYTSNAPDSAIEVSNATQTPTTQTVPEFPIAMLVMMISITSVVVFYRIKSVKL